MSFCITKKQISQCLSSINQSARITKKSKTSKTRCLKKCIFFASKSSISYLVSILFFAFTLRFRVSINVFLLRIMLFLSIINREQYFKIIVVVAILSSHEKNHINRVIEASTYLFLTLYYY